MKAEGNAEVYRQDSLSTMPLHRRMCAIAYVAWLFVEGLFTVVDQFLAAPTSYSRLFTIDRCAQYFVCSGLLLVLLHSYIGSPRARSGFQWTTLLHQIGLIAFSLWKYTNYVVNKNERSWDGLRGVVLCYFAIMGDARDVILEICGAVDEKTLDNVNARKSKS